MNPSKKKESKKEMPSKKWQMKEEVSVEEIFNSLRWWVTFQICNSALWLLIATGLIGLALFELIFPELAPNFAAANYGRLIAASSTALLYGFAFQSLMIIAIYSCAVSNKVKLSGGGLMFGSLTLWNIGVFVAVIAALAGDTTGYEWFELPYYSGTILFLASLLFAIQLALILNNRSVERLHPSNWFWIILVFGLLLLIVFSQIFFVRFPIEGAGQILFHNWFKNLAFNVIISGGIVGSLFYFAPMILETELYSRRLALCAFFGIVIFGGYGGLSLSMPLPRWVIEVNNMFYLFMIIPFTAVFINLFFTVKNRKSSNIGLRYLYLAIIFWGIHILTGLASVNTEVNKITEFTLYSAGRDYLLILSTMFAFMGCAEVILPQFGRSKKSSFQFYVVLIGALIFSLSYLAGGFIQGTNYYDYRVKFSDVIISVKPFIFTALLGSGILFVGALIFLYRCSAVVISLIKTKQLSKILDETTEQKIAV